jgi:hypothetical protein
MTNAEDTLSSAGNVSAPEHVVSGLPAPSASTSESATPVDAIGRRHGRHVRPRPTISRRKVVQDRKTRLWLLASSLIGAGCLVLSYCLRPGEGSAFAYPSDVAGWFAVIVGIAGVWLVPGLWMSAVVLRTGSGAVARLTTRIGATLTWYVLVGPIVHLVARGAAVTTGDILGVTVAATAAVCLGVAFSLAQPRANPLLRFLMAGVVGGICAQAVIWLSSPLQSYGLNYEIRRLDGVIVFACAILAAIGAHGRPYLPLVRRPRQIGTVLIALAVAVVTAGLLFAVGSRWSPAQRMPSAFGAEQVAAPAEADLAFALSAIGPEGSDKIQHANFTASDDVGRPVAVNTSLVPGATADSATLVLVVDPVSKPQLCDRTLGGSLQSSPAKLTVRDQVSGVVVQGIIPADRCAQ